MPNRQENFLADQASQMVADLLPQTIAVIIFTESGYHVNHRLPDETLKTLINAFSKEFNNGQAK